MPPAASERGRRRHGRHLHRRSWRSGLRGNGQIRRRRPQDNLREVARQPSSGRHRPLGRGGPGRRGFGDRNRLGRGWRKRRRLNAWRVAAQIDHRRRHRRRRPLAGRAQARKARGPVTRRTIARPGRTAQRPFPGPGRRHEQQAALAASRLTRGGDALGRDLERGRANRAMDTHQGHVAAVGRTRLQWREPVRKGEARERRARPAVPASITDQLSKS